MTSTAMPDKVHQGKNIRHFREMLDMKQEALATELGGDWTQRKVSLLEQKETIEPEILEEVAKVLKVPVKAIEKFTEESAFFHIQNMYDHAAIYQYNFNPIDKIVSLYDEKVELYERMIKEKNEMIEKLLGEKKK